MKIYLQVGFKFLFIFLLGRQFEVVAQCYSPVVYPATQQALRYSLDNTTADASGSGNPAVLQGSPTFVTDRFGTSNYAISISGSTQLVSNTSLITGIADFTLSIWIKTNTTVGGWIVGRTNGTSNDRKIFMDNNGNVKFGIWNGSSVTSISSLTSLNDNKWHHIVATHSTASTGTIALYVDNVFQSTLAAKSADGTSGNWILGNGTNWASAFGIANGSTNDYLNGSIDDFVYYTRVVSPAEILALYSPYIHGTSQISSSVCVGGVAVLNVNTIVGTVAGYNWRLNGAVISGGIYSGFNTSSLTITGVSSTLTGSFSVTASGVCGNFTTSGVTLTITAATFASNGATNISTCEGLNLSFPLRSITGKNISYQWLKDDAIIINNATFTGAASSLLGINAATIAQNANYKCVLTGDCGIFTTAGFDLTVIPLTSISGITSNQGALTCEGSNFTITSNFISGTNVNYQWLANGIPITSGFGGSFTTTGLQFLSPSATLGGINYALSAAGVCGSMVTSTINPFIGQTTSALNPAPSLNVCGGTSLSLNLVFLKGVNNTYQWFQDGALITALGSNFTSITTSGLGLTNLPPGFSATFSGIVSGGCDLSGPITVAGTYINVFESTSIVGLSNLNLDTCPGTALNIAPSTVLGTQLNYRWLKNGSFITAATDGGIYGNSFTTTGLTLTTSGFSGSYVLSATGFCGVSTALGLTLITRANTVITNPASLTNYCDGSNLSFSVNSVTGFAINYTWLFGNSGGGPYQALVNNSSIVGFGGTLTGVNSNILNINNVPSGLNGKVFVISATGFCSTTLSGEAALNQNANTIVIDPPSTVVSQCVGGTALYVTSVIGSSATAWYGKIGTNPWQRLGEDFQLFNTTGTGNRSLGVSAFVLTVTISPNPINANTANGYQFAISATGICNSVFNTLTGYYLHNVRNGPDITTQPINSATCLGSNMSLFIVASGTSLTYQWWKGVNTTSGTLITASTDGGIYGTTFTNAGLNFNVPQSISGANYFSVLNTSCGATTTGIATVSVEVNPNAGIVTPPFNFNSCPGYPAIVVATATGTKLSYIWQILNTTTGIWSNLSEGGNFQNTTSTSLTLPTPPNSLSGSQFSFTAGNYCKSVSTTGITFNANGIPFADFFGLKSQYCTNEGASDLTSASNFTFAGGSFISTPSFSGLILSTLAGTARFQPFVITAPTALAISYITPSNGTGCVTTITYSTFVNTVDAVDFYSPSLTQYIYKSGSIADLQALPSVGGVGAFAGTGVIANKFYVDLINSIGNTTVNFNFTNTTTGCVSSASKTINIQTNFDKFKYLPASEDNRPVSITGFANNRFCIDDNAQYNISFTGITPEDNSNQFFSVDCVKSLGMSFAEPSASTSLIPTSTLLGFYIGCSSSTTMLGRNNRLGYKFIPKNIASEGVYNLKYNLDKNSSPCSYCMDTPRSSFPANASQFSEQVTILGLSPAPISTSTILTFCGTVTGLSNVATTVLGSNVEWYYLTTPGVLSTAIPLVFPANSPTLAQINQKVPLIANGTNAGYDFRIRQNTNGCKSSYIQFKIIIFDKPIAPVISSATINSVYCKGDVSINPKLVVNTVTGGYTAKWYEDAAGTIPIATPNPPNEFSPNPRRDKPSNTNYYAAMNNQGCNSDLTVFNVKVNNIPYDTSGSTISFITPQTYCVNTVSGISVAGFNASLTVSGLRKLTGPTEYVWYLGIQDSIGVSPVTTVAGPSTGDVIYNTTFYSGYTNTTVNSVDFSTRLVYSAVGNRCKSDFSNVEKLRINGIPSSPTVTVASSNWSAGTNTLGPLCNIDVVPQLYATSLESNPAFTWYYNSTLTGTSVLGSGFTPNLTTTSATTTNYYATQKVFGCESLPTEVTVIRNAALSVPGFILPLPGYYCTGQLQVDDITAVGLSNTLSGFYWYKNSVNPLNRLANAQTYNPKASATPKNDFVLLTQFESIPPLFQRTCESAPMIVNFEYRGTPAIPSSRDTAFCENSSLPLVTISGAILADSPLFRWYADAGLTAFINNGITVPGANLTVLGINKASIPWVGTFSGGFLARGKNIIDSAFYVTQVVNGCESLPDTVVYSLVKKPSQPQITTTDSLYCSDELFASLNSIVSTGSEIKWYYNSLSTLLTVNSANFFINNNYSNKILWTLPGVGGLDSLVHKFYLTQTLYKINTNQINFGGCESDPARVTIKVFPLPPAPQVISAVPAYCGNNALTVYNFTSVGFNHPSLQLTWYSTSNTSNRLRTGNEYPPSDFTKNPVYPAVYTNTFYARQTIKGCESDSMPVKLIINPTPVLGIVGLASSYCINSNDATIAGFNVASTVTGAFSFDAALNTGVVNIPGGKAILSPTVIAPNDLPYSLNYIVNNEYNCSNTFTGVFKVNPLPSVSFTKSGTTVVGFDAYICQNADQFSLVPNPTGGVFSVNNSTSGGSNLLFIPSSFGLGNQSVNYSYTNALTNCQNVFYATTTIVGVPEVNFTFSSFCTEDTITYLNLSTVAGVAGSYLLQNEWRGINYSYNSTLTSPINPPFPKFGDYTTKLTSTTNFGCISSTTLGVKIGRKPDIAISWNKICADQSTAFFDNSSLLGAAGVVSSREWDFGTGFATYGNPGFSFKLNNLGQNAVAYRVVSDKGCKNDSSFVINILPVIGSTSYPSIFDFNTDSSGWYSTGRNSSWVLNADSNSVFNKNSNGKYWSTRNDSGTYNILENSFIYSPCFNLSVLSKPMVSLNYASDNLKGAEGGVLQYSLNDGNTWNLIGDLGTGINWYDQKDITANPGDQVNFNLGWSGTTVSKKSEGRWLNARHSLDTLSGKTNVRFRIAFSAIEPTSTFVGFAFDDFKIGSRSKSVLFENFVNANSAVSNTVSASVIEVLLNKYKKDAIAIDYHTSFPNSNPFNNSNPADPSARVLYYGVESVPRTFLNGNQQFGVSSSSDLLSDTAIVKRSLESPYFDIALTSNAAANGANISYSADFIPLAEYGDPSPELVGYIALVERDVANVTGAGGKNSFDWINRKLLPNAGGVLLYDGTAKVEIGDNKNMFQLWNVDNTVADINNLGVIAFIQDNKTKEVLQSKYVGPRMYVGTFTGNIPTTGIAKALSDKDIVVYPNPTSGEINIQLNRELTKDISYTVFDILGNMMTAGTIGKEISLKKIDASDYPAGVYFLKVDGLIKKVMVIK